jgi:hypothetical protein
MNSIRPDALASLLSKDEAKNGIRPEKGERKIRDLSLESTVSRKIGMHGVVGDRMVGSWSDMNQGSRAGKERRSWPQGGPEEPSPEGDRASVVARKRGNARGAKGGRKVETTNKAKKEKRTVNVLWTQSGEEQHKYAKLRLFEQCLLAAPVTGDNRGWNLTPINGCAGRPPLEPNYQLESRMREICQSGSEGRGKAHHCPYPYLSPGFSLGGPVFLTRRSEGP